MAGRTGLFGGTFNPVHLGHLRVAEEALRQFGLREVVFVVTGQPPHREVAEGVSPEDRYAMVCEAVRGRPRFSVSRAEIDRPGPSFTVDTVAALSAVYPDGVAYIVGADIFARIESWRDWRRLLASCPFIVAPRPGTAAARFEGPPFNGADVQFLEMPLVAVSSSEVRRRYREGQSVDGLVPLEVDHWIRNRGLYGVAPPRTGG